MIQRFELRVVYTFYSFTSCSTTSWQNGTLTLGLGGFGWAHCNNDILAPAPIRI